MNSGAHQVQPTTMTLMSSACAGCSGCRQHHGPDGRHRDADSRDGHHGGAGSASGAGQATSAAVSRPYLSVFLAGKEGRCERQQAAGPVVLCVKQAKRCCERHITESWGSQGGHD